MKISIRKADTEFSRYLKMKTPHCEISTCQNTESLQCSHYWGRRHENTRYDQDNCDVLCFHHHQHFEENPQEYYEWKLNKLGEKKFKDLKIRANLYRKRDDKLSLLAVRELARQYNEN